MLINVKQTLKYDNNLKGSSINKLTNSLLFFYKHQLI